MKIVDSIIHLLSHKPSVSTGDVPHGMCPNCWGRNEYAGSFYEAVKSEGIDVNEIDNHVGWVQDYANKHLNDIALEAKDDHHVCHSCKIQYRQVT